MDNYNNYVNAINKIFEYLDVMKKEFDDQDNLNYIASIEEYKNAIISNAELLKETNNNMKVEALGND